MSESADSRHQHHADHADPPQVPSDDRDRARDEARRWVRRKRIFSTIVGVYLALSLMWFVIDMLDDSTGLWFYWPMLGTGLVVVVTGLGMFGLGGLFGAESCLVVAAIGFALQAAVLLLSPVPALQRQPEMAQ